MNTDPLEQFVLNFLRNHGPCSISRMISFAPGTVDERKLRNTMQAMAMQNVIHSHDAHTHVDSVWMIPE